MKLNILPNIYMRGQLNPRYVHTLSTRGYVQILKVQFFSSNSFIRSRNKKECLLLSALVYFADFHNFLCSTIVLCFKYSIYVCSRSSYFITKFYVSFTFAILLSRNRSCHTISLCHHHTSYIYTFFDFHRQQCCVLSEKWCTLHLKDKPIYKEFNGSGWAFSSRIYQPTNNATNRTQKLYRMLDIRKPWVIIFLWATVFYLFVIRLCFLSHVIYTYVCIYIHNHILLKKKKNLYHSICFSY